MNSCTVPYPNPHKRNGNLDVNGITWAVSLANNLHLTLCLAIKFLLQRVRRSVLTELLSIGSAGSMPLALAGLITMNLDKTRQHLAI